MSDLFWSRVAVRGADECWPFAARRSPLGYGRIEIDGFDWYAHRYAYTLKNGPIPKGMVVCHKCDWPPCCNPAHLVAAQNGENIRDAARKGRMLRVLTLAQVAEIKAKRKAGAGVAELARLMGVSLGCIKGHVRGIPKPPRTRRARAAARSQEKRPHNTPIVFLAKAAGGAP